MLFQGSHRVYTKCQNDLYRSKVMGSCCVKRQWKCH